MRCRRCAVVAWCRCVAVVTWLLVFVVAVCESYDALDASDAEEDVEVGRVEAMNAEAEAEQMEREHELEKEPTLMREEPVGDQPRSSSWVGKMLGRDKARQ